METFSNRMFVSVVLTVLTCGRLLIADDGPVEKSATTSSPTAASSTTSTPGMMSWVSIYEQIVNPNSQTTTSREGPTATVPAFTPPIEEGGRNPNTPLDARTYAIHVGDKLGYRIVEDHDEGRILNVSLSGEIDIPFLGPVSVAGKRLNDAAKEIGAMLEKELYKQATVILSVEETTLPKMSSSNGSPQLVASGPPVRPKKITLVGQVRTPGLQEFPLDGKLTLTEAILKAGGFASFANGKKVKVIRRKADGTSETIMADVMAVLKDGKLEADIDLKPDDLVIVPEKWLNF